MNRVLVSVFALCAASYAVYVPAAVEPVNVPYNNTNSTHTNRTISLINLKQTDLTLTKIGEKSYYISTTKMNWFAASDFCHSKNWNFASVNSAQEHELLVAHLANVSTMFWVSLNKLANKDEWVWSGLGVKSTFFNWDDGEPNNSGGNENCVEIKAPNEKGMMWNDLSCNYELSFICEARSCENQDPIPAPSKPNNTQTFFTKVFSWSVSKLM